MGTNSICIPSEKSVHWETVAGSHMLQLTTYCTEQLLLKMENERLENKNYVMWTGLVQQDCNPS